MVDTEQEQANLDTADGTMRAKALQATRISIRRRRLQRSLFDLQLDRILGFDWCRIGDDGFEFGPLSDRQSDRLVRALEDMATRIPSAVPVAPGADQGQFDF